MGAIDPRLVGWLEETYRDLHRHPELGMNEHRTTALIRSAMAESGVERIPLPGLEVGAAGILRGKEPGPVLALRADIDALPIQEETPVPYASQTLGVMHACGHDLNTTVLLGVMKHLAQSCIAERMKGALKFIFQPAEETLKGARAMIEAGVLQGPQVDAILMSHGDPELKVGEVALFDRYSHASSDHFFIELSGKGGHGSRPHQTQDLILAGAYLVNVLQSIVSRDVDAREAVVLSVCSFNAGTASNVLPASAKLSGTVRTLAAEAQQTVMKRMQEACEGLGTLFHMKTALEYVVGVPSCPVDASAETLLHRAACDVIGADRVRTSQTRMGGEDFAFYAQKVPAGVMRLGISPPEGGRFGSTHSPTFQVDLRAIPVGVSILSRAAEFYLS